jgi:hypothetical protein
LRRGGGGNKVKCDLNLCIRANCANMSTKKQFIAKTGVKS